MTILSLLNRIFNADQTPNNTVSWSGTNGLKGIQDDIAEELRARGSIVVPTTIELNNQGKNNSQNAIVQGIGLYTWFPASSGPANGSNIVSANDGGFWVLQAVGNFFPNVVTDLASPASGVSVYAKADTNSVNILKISGPVYFKDITTIPATPIGGIVLYSQAGVLKYKDPTGTVHTL
jgi:hypothetical protein